MFWDRDRSYASENIDSFILGLTYLHTRISRFRLTSNIFRTDFSMWNVVKKRSESQFEILLKDVYNQFWFFEIEVANDKILLI